MSTESSTNHGSTTYDIVIVGAGMVGASIACALARTERPLRIALIEAGPEPHTFSGNNFDPRVVALTRSSEQFLASFGAWSFITEARLCPYTDMHVWDSEGTASIHFDCRDVQQPNLGHIIENSVVTRAVLQCLADSPGVELLRPARVADLQAPPTPGQPVQITLADGSQFKTPLLVAADGANSFVRRMARVRTREWDYGHKAIVTTVRTELPHQFTAWQRFMSTGPLAFLPLQLTNTGSSDSHFSSIVWSAESTLADELMALDDAAFCNALGQALELRLGPVEHSDPRFCLPLRQRHAVEYIQPGIALVGDAAHTIHPLAGQGVNLGLLDATALVAEIRRGQARGLPLGDYSILRRYQRQRLGSNLGMMSAMEGFKRLFGSRHLPLRWVRNAGMAQLDQLPLLKNFIIKQAMGL